MGPPRVGVSVRATVLAAAFMVAAMTLVAGAVSWIVYARIESLLLDVAEVQSQTLTHALRLADSGNRYAASGGEIAAARNQIQRQNAALALAQQSQALHEAMAALHRIRIAADAMPAIETLAATLEEALERQNMAVSTRIELETRARRLSTELNRLQAAVEDAGRTIPHDEPADGTADRFESAAAQAMLRLYEAGQIDHEAPLQRARRAFGDARERLAAVVGAIEGTRRGESERHLAMLDALAVGADGVFPVREALIGTGREIDRLAIQARELATRLGISVGQLVGEVEAHTQTTRRAVAAQIAQGRAWLFAVAVATFLGPVVLVWLAVGRSIVLPLARLAAATRRIAAGDLQAPIPASSHREFQEIGDALAVFRDNTAALADRTRALQASEDSERTARHQAETALADLRDTQEQLIQAEKMAALASLVAGVAHEINTPLGIAVTATSLLAEEMDGMETAVRSGTLRRADFEQFVQRCREIATLMMANIDRAAGLIHAFKQVAADQSSDQRRSFDLADVLDQTLVSVRPACQRAGHGATLSCPPGIVMDSHPGAVSQVLTILVVNAVEHAFAPGQRGTIRVTAAVERESTARIDVIDDGRGIPADLHRRVFEPFFTTRRGAGNTGLGLHIAFNIVRQGLKGRIDLVPGPGGAHFTVRIPLSLPAEPAADPAR